MDSHSVFSKEEIEFIRKMKERPMRISSDDLFFESTLRQLASGSNLWERFVNLEIKPVKT